MINRVWILKMLASATAGVNYAHFAAPVDLSARQ